MKKTLFAVALDAIAIWIYEKTRRRLPAPDEMDRLRAATPLIADLFGPTVELSTAWLPDGGVEVRVRCRQCNQKNRLSKGFEGACCGKCGLPLTVKGLAKKPVTVN